MSFQEKVESWEKRRVAVALIFLSITFSLLADPLPPPPVLSPQEERETFRLAELGYRIELVASEPMVQDPVAITFDGQGRLWVVEMRGYMQDIDGNGAKDSIGRVSVLEDVDGDGIMDRSTVFANGLILPRAILVLPDGVLIGENEPLYFHEDHDGDLVSDRKTLVDARFAKDNIEHSANGLMRGMDNWIYVAKEGHRYRRNGSEWIREETEERGQWGICQDDRGRLFYNYNHSQLHADLVPPNSLTRNPNHDPVTGLSVGITNTNQVFPIRPTPAANRGYIPGVLDERGRIQEFTSACAPLIYRGTLYPDWRGNSFVCEPVGNLIKRSILSDTGVRVTGVQAYLDRDFLASTDERFRPCWLTEGPDGALYIADIYRGIVQDNPYMSPYLREISERREMAKPIHLGRIWRVVPEDFQQPHPPDFASLATGELVETLAHPSGWWRDQAQIWLVEGGQDDSMDALIEMALHHPEPIARQHALWTIEGLGNCDPDSLVDALSDAEPWVAATALRVLVSLNASDSQKFLQMRPADITAAEIDEYVLRSLLILGEVEFSNSAKFRLIEAYLRAFCHDPLMRDAALSTLFQDEAAFLGFWWPNLIPTEEIPGQAYMVEALSRAILRSGDGEHIAALLALLDSENWSWKEQAVSAGVSVHSAILKQNPIGLASEPQVVNRKPEWRSCFSWPGHIPEPPSKEESRPLTEKEQELFVRGRQIFLTTCVACHGADGKGLKMLAPPLAGSDWVLGSEERLVRVLFHGLSGPIQVSGKRYTVPEVQPTMPPLANLNNEDIASVLTYVRREWGNNADPISSSEVSQHRIKAQGRTIPWTEEELAPFAGRKK